MTQGGIDDNLVLADLAPFGDVDELTAQVRAQARAAGDDERRPDRFEGADLSDSIWVVVDGRGRLVDLDVSRDWAQRIAPADFAETLWRTYASAAQQAITSAAVAALSASEAGARQEARADPASAAGHEVDKGEWLAGVWTALEAGRATLDRLGNRSTASAERTLTSPNGILTLRLAGSGIVGIGGDTRLIRATDAAQLRGEALAAFRTAGVTSGAQPRA